MSINLADKAYAKIMLHCIKHNVSDCIGVVIGKESDGHIEVQDVIPLFHERVFAAQLEIALKFVFLVDIR
jgi:hypothetical protein